MIRSEEKHSVYQEHKRVQSREKQNSNVNWKKSEKEIDRALLERGCRGEGEGEGWIKQRRGKTERESRRAKDHAKNAWQGLSILRQTHSVWQMHSITKKQFCLVCFSFFWNDSGLQDSNAERGRNQAGVHNSWKWIFHPVIRSGSDTAVKNQANEADKAQAKTKIRSINKEVSQKKANRHKT